MNQPISQNRSDALAEAQKQPYALRFSTDEIERALASALEIFADFEQTYGRAFNGVIVPQDGIQRPTSFAQELIPALLCAHRFFGDSLPTGLNQKLKNPPQTHDTLFELICLGAFHPHHEIHYEPTLANGGTADLMLSLRDQQQVFVECKCQRIKGSEHDRLFTKAATRIHEILGLERSKVVENAWAGGLRTEVHLVRTPSKKDLDHFAASVESQSLVAVGPSVSFGEAITVLMVSRDEPFDPSQPPPSAVMQVATTPTAVHHRNVHTAVYPWPGLDIIRRRSQRRLLTSARRRLRHIPPDAHGLICIQAFSSSRFAPDIHALLPQKEFERVPIVWMNPNSTGQLICRGDALLLRDRIFSGMLADLGNAR